MLYWRTQPKRGNAEQSKRFARLVSPGCMSATHERIDGRERILKASGTVERGPARDEPIPPHAGVATFVRRTRHEPPRGWW